MTHLYVYSGKLGVTSGRKEVAILSAVKSFLGVPYEGYLDESCFEAAKSEITTSDKEI